MNLQRVLVSREILIFHNRSISCIADNSSMNTNQMNTDQLCARLAELQNEVNQLVDQFPPGTKFSFGTVYSSDQMAERLRKHLVISVNLAEYTLTT